MAANGTNGVHADPASWRHYNEGTFLFTVRHYLLPHLQLTARG